MDLVTVTHRDDINQMILQAESIQKFLSPCAHWIVINDINPDIEYWKSQLSKYYTKHKLYLLTTADFDQHCPRNKLPSYGWQSQQYYKLKIAEMIKGKYLILDSKNFFIKPTKLSEWNDVIGCGIKNTWKEETNEYFYKVAKNYSESLNVKMTDDYLLWTTPFVIDPNILKSANHFNKLENYLYTNDGTSEFLFYSLLMKNHPDYINFVEHKKHFTIWNQYVNDDDIKDVFYRRIKTVSVIGIHRKFVDKLEHKVWINSWLKETGFEFQF